MTQTDPPEDALPAPPVVARGETVPGRPALDRRLEVALAVATLALTAAFVALLAWGEAILADPRELLGLLVAAGALCLAALTARRSPVVAWPALVLCGIAATGIPVRLAADLLGSDLVPEPAGDWAPVALVVTVCASGTALVAALYATRPELSPTRALRWLAFGLTAWLAAAALATIVLVLAGLRETPGVQPLDLVMLPIQGWLLIVLGLAALGVVGDLRPAIRRTQLRAAAGDVVRPGPAGWMATLFDELAGRGEGRRAAAEAERRRLASDLHAEAMPALRRALRDVEAGRPAEEVALELRALADELEGVVTERRDPVLEALGLVGALEALAERTEDRGGPRVELEVGGANGVGADGQGVAPPDRPPPGVEAAALRIAGLAIDNATRHGSASRIEVTVSVARSAVSVAIDDDGPGIAPGAEARALGDGRHGIADMRRLAAEQGGRLSIGPGAGGGTLVRFDWRG